MKSFTTFAALIVLGASLVAGTANATTLVVPSQLEVQSGATSMSAQAQVVNLEQGKQLLELVYRDMFADNADDSGAWIRSASLFLTLNVAQEGQYRLQLPKIASKEAQAFIKQPKLQLVSQQGQVKQVALLDHQQLMTQLWQAQ
ncbi:DUF2057 domain-containing protein [Shewanella sp. AS1]|uniref:DUF2057 family protein n=1 Tax=Shewanella sp. AS1 TaxID=2907626 RepID=UPI001F274B86|nr:DUF2057 family protein [Shewanella sp. AS1]MCE9680369.1 DUF2057 domain-containing protein [Shewanella sp. AS1]